MEKSKKHKTVVDDRTYSLSTLRARAGKPLRNAILDIYANHQSSNEKSTEFLRNLKCFFPTENGDGHFCDNDKQRGHVKIPLRKCFHPKHYVAISYPWSPSIGEPDNASRYKLEGSNIPVRDIVLDRIIRFIRYRSRDFIPFWIDQLSINQENKYEHDIGMQSMDQVYKKCKYAIGYLWAEIKTQTQVNLLRSLLSNQVVKYDPDERLPILNSGIDAEAAGEILDVLAQITDDKWWSRAWIFQEDYLAGTKMWLLIRHAKGLDKSYARNELGSLPGELVIKSNTFRKYLTWFCLALCQKASQSPFVVYKCEKMLKKAGKYNVLYQHNNGIRSTARMITTNVLKDLNSRKISVLADMLAITANVCGYDKRISVADDEDSAMSLSLGILTLCISNGEIVQDEDGRPKLYENVFDFLDSHVVNVSAPLSEGALTFIKHCRIPVDSLSSSGIHTKGILWKLSDIIHPNRFRQESVSHGENPSQRDLYRHGPSDYQQGRLWDLVELLRGRNKRRYQRLANDLARYLRLQKRLNSQNDWPTRHAMDLMAACIVGAMDAGKYLQLARPVRGPSKGHNPSYRAVFIRDKCDIQRSGPGYIFTSWAPTKEAIAQSNKCKTLAKYVSLEVAIGEMNGSEFWGLRSRKWVNGLCFFDREEKSPFVFPWPEALWS